MSYLKEKESTKQPVGFAWFILLTFLSKHVLFLQKSFIKLNVWEVQFLAKVEKITELEAA